MLLYVFWASLCLGLIRLPAETMWQSQVPPQVLDRHVRCTAVRVSNSKCQTERMAAPHSRRSAAA
jgi:hypothetical protein